MSTGTTAMARASDLQAIGTEVARRLVRRLPSRSQSASPAPLEAPWAHSVGDVSLRPIRASDQMSWSAAMALNGRRMQPWWDSTASWEEVTSREAFFEHYVTWRRMETNGAGLLRAIVGPGGVAGELALFSKAGGKVMEAGLWAAPGRVPSLDMLGVLSSQVEELMTRCGVRRIEAPVAVDNRRPLRILHIAGFVREGLLRESRPLGDTMVDMELYALTVADWAEGRRRLADLTAWTCPAAFPRGGAPRG